MKKSSFVAMIMGAAGGIACAIGMCMCLLPEWNAFTPGVVLGCGGIAVLLTTVLIWRKMEGKAPLRPSGKHILTALVGIAGALLLGVGMCFTMVWSSLILGIIIGIAGIAALLSVIPLHKGVR